MSICNSKFLIRAHILFKGFTPYFLGIKFSLNLAVFESQITFFDQGIRKTSARGPDLVQIADPIDRIGPAIFRVQTVPHKSGILEFIVQFRKPEVGSDFQNLFNYKTTKPYPYGITYAVFGSKNTSAATYRIRDGINIIKLIKTNGNTFPVDRLPSVFPIADCREGYNTGLTTRAGGEVSVAPLNIDDPVSIGNVAANQKWCVIGSESSCAPCGPSRTARGHVQTRENGKIVNTDGCKYLKAEAEANGAVTWTVSFNLSFNNLNLKMYF